MVEQIQAVTQGRRSLDLSHEIRQAIIRMAKENPGWGYLRIVGERLKLRCLVGKTSARRILREEDLYPKPRPDRAGRAAYRPWEQFITLHVNTLVACDFFCKTVWTLNGKRDADCLFFIHVGTRKAWGSPATFHPNEAWVRQQSRNVLMWLEG